jgi:hypothetical protein
MSLLQLGHYVPIHACMLGLLFSVQLAESE